MVTDPKTGKPRGYGFCDFYDIESARSAIRNLNNLEINGRTIKVDFADNEGAGSNFDAPRGDRDSKDLKDPRDPRSARDMNMVLSWT